MALITIKFYDPFYYCLICVIIVDWWVTGAKVAVEPVDYFIITPITLVEYKIITCEQNVRDLEREDDKEDMFCDANTVESEDIIKR